MAALSEAVFSLHTMSQPTRKMRRATRKLAADQSLAKPLEFSPQEARGIAEKGAQDLVEEGLPPEYVAQYRVRTEELLTKPLSW